MNPVENDMIIRMQEIEKIVNLVKDIESGNNLGEQNIITTTPVIKASIVLALYNVVESTVTNTLVRLHNIIIQQNVKYDDVRRELKDICLIYYQYHNNKKNNPHEALDVLHSTLNLIRGISCFALPYKEMAKEYQLYSGNLDAKEIRRIFGKYGIVIPEEETGKNLQKIKNARNKLAHGEQSFEEYGRTLVISTIEVYKKQTSLYLQLIINIVKEYITDKSYLAINA
ncbi:MAE_28990/MAE_18760 family HEPN-like nuclease [Pantoea sp. X85]|uniref:MAE_28990/MAE_18760 family HEPN-like nuclease n=1 Tax=Pantoea sp. X85 TaxID=3037258 RepID=UPI002413C56B|nr:MAE_28990/MAE_18760 family HEPN-like nuclease [Pantoea sp. X85]WFL68035.1 MAE_28990/MAE_18760 family HEPN-like nuclease [Pantoea sp. X85]